MGGNYPRHNLFLQAEGPPTRSERRRPDRRAWILAQRWQRFHFSFAIGIKEHSPRGTLQTIGRKTGGRHAVQRCRHGGLYLLTRGENSLILTQEFLVSIERDLTKPSAGPRCIRCSQPTNFETLTRSFRWNYRTHRSAASQPSP